MALSKPILYRGLSNATCYGYITRIEIDALRNKIEVTVAVYASQIERDAEPLAPLWYERHEFNRPAAVDNLLTQAYTALKNRPEWSGSIDV